MCETFEMFRKAGEREGREIGRAEGRKEEREKMQNDFLKVLIRSKRFTPSEISSWFNIPMDVVLERAKQLSLS